MTYLCLALAALAAVLITGSPARRRAAERLTPSAAVPVRTSSGRRLWTVGGVVALLVIGLVHRWAGAPAAVVTTAVAIVVATCIRLTLNYAADREAARAEQEVAHACSVLAAQIRVGRVPAEALPGAARDCPVLDTARKAQDLGGDVTAVWRRQAALRGHRGLLVLARAWQVSTETGAPLAHSLEQVAEALTADVALRAVVAGELSAARATGKIMAALPLFGLGMGYALGGDPLHFLLSSSLGWACLLVGVTLAAGGVLWIDRLARPTVS
ncbi:MAG TPA: type II secretion system protein [Propionibacteriaceae bacterium]|nr:type II secretion system protein [Propionibacteriaceae bacterium]